MLQKFIGFSYIHNFLIQKKQKAEIRQWINILKSL